MRADVGSGKFDQLNRYDVRGLARGLLACDPETINRCVEFILAETRGSGHGRARAMMCRRLKHCDLSPEMRERLVECIINRLVTGNFAEQFRDQLRLAIHLDPERTSKEAHKCLASPSRMHIHRLAKWVVEQGESSL